MIVTTKISESKATANVSNLVLIFFSLPGHDDPGQFWILGAHSHGVLIPNHSRIVGAISE